MFRPVITIAALLAGTAGAAAERSADSQDNDPMVCRVQHETGSRLSKKKVCMKRSEWAEQKRRTRMQVEKQQLNRGTSN